MSSLEVDPHLRDSVKTQVRHFASDFSALDQAFPGTYPRMIVRAEGAYLFDEDGHRSLDAGVSLGVCQIGVAYMFLTAAMRVLPALEVSLLLLIEPVLNPIWTWMIRGERPGTYTIIGGAIIIAATAIKSIYDSRVPALPAQMAKSG